MSFLTYGIHNTFLYILNKESLEDFQSVSYTLICSLNCHAARLNALDLLE